MKHGRIAQRVARAIAQRAILRLLRNNESISDGNATGSTIF